MIGPISFLWKQLNGPQITAFTKSVYNWAVDEFDRTLEYLNNLSISTANSKHLSFLGMLANFSRPFIRKLNLSLFFFTESPQSDFVHGFSSLEDVGVGGKVVALEQLYETMENEPLKDSVYRELLLAYANSEGEIGSITLLDDILKRLRDSFGSKSFPPEYSITVCTEKEAGGEDIGDLKINIGKSTSWQDAEDIITAMEAVCNTAYAPLPRVFLSFEDA